MNRETLDYWKKYFEKFHLPYVVRNINEDWDIIEVDDSKVEESKLEEVFGNIPLSIVRASYALGCRKCGRWFFNGFYQTTCKCGNPIPKEYWYP